jgi:D-alanyl-lipoteichoic acid acyltransferase DltB (MBOAT superfamily)
VVDLGPLGQALVHHGWKEVVAAVTSVRGRGEGISTPRSHARMWFPSAGRVLTRTTALNFSAVLSSTAHPDSFNFYIGFWLKSFVLLGFSYQLLFSLSSFSWDVFSTNVWVSAIPLFFCLLIVLAALAFDHTHQSKFKYLIFFSITITSALGLTKTLTGSHAESKNVILYGFSFYTASIAYLIHSQQLSAKSIAVVSNPLLLITGPIATYFRPIDHYSFKKRFKYFFPYIVVGLFLHQAIATPLTTTFHLIALTDILSSCAFAVIFELFVYANFCGLSLLIYGVCGIMGVRVPLNFKQPFSSTNIVEYWRGWHTTLSVVLKSLFYTPTKQILGTFPAILFVYLASAMWHGTTLNFVVWGLFHASVFILTIVFLRRRASAISFALMIVGIVAGRAIFSDSDFHRLLEKLTFKYDGLVVLPKLIALTSTTKLALLLGISFIAVEMVFQNYKYFKQRNYKFYRIPIIQLILVIITLLAISDGSGVDYAVYGQR